jgi:hypothetical protein
MDDHSRRQEILRRITELIEEMPEDVLLQLIQRWEAELTELFPEKSINTSEIEDKSYTSDKT